MSHCRLWHAAQLDQSGSASAAPLHALMAVAMGGSGHALRHAGCRQSQRDQRVAGFSGHHRCDRPPERRRRRSGLASMIVRLPHASTLRDFCKTQPAS